VIHRPAALLLALLALTLTAACDGGSESNGAGATVTATAAPSITATATAAPSITATATAKSEGGAGTMPTTPSTATASPTAAASATSTPGAGPVGPVFIYHAELLMLQSLPVELVLHVQGALPTPCHRLSWQIEPGPDTIRVRLASIADVGRECAQVIEPFDQRLPLGAFESGSFTVWLNGETVGAVDLGRDGGGDVVAAELGQAARLHVGDTLEVTGTTLRLRFLRVSTDSRCPGDVTCVWAGEAILVFIAEGTGEADREVAVRLSPQHGVAGLGAYVLDADDLLPVPRTSTTILPGDYEVTVAIEPIAPATGSGIAGLVTVGPACPVVRADLPCPDRPYAGTLVVSDLQDVERGRVTADADGRYSLALSPGTYRITPLSPPGMSLPRASLLDVVVPAGWAVVNISYDSGIR